METEENLELLSPWWHRLIHFLVDYAMVWWLARSIAEFYIKQFTFSRDFFWIQVIIPSLIVISVLYFFAFEYWLQMTPGKLLTRARVVSVRGSKPSAWQTLIRSLSRLLFFDVLTFFAIRPIGWHDYLSSTRVVRARHRSSQSLPLEQKQGFTRFLLRTTVGFQALVLIFLVSASYFMFTNWHQPKILSVNDYEWSTVMLDQAVTIAAPGDIISVRGKGGAWRVRLGLFQDIAIRKLPRTGEPGVWLHEDIAQAQIHPLSLVKLSEYVATTTASGEPAVWYQYSLVGVPFRAAGFFIAGEEAWYQVDFRGFKRDAGSVLRHMFDSSIGQTTSL